MVKEQALSANMSSTVCKYVNNKRKTEIGNKLRGKVKQKRKELDDDDKKECNNARVYSFYKEQDDDYLAN